MTDPATITELEPLPCAECDKAPNVHRFRATRFSIACSDMTCPNCKTFQGSYDEAVSMWNEANA